MKRLGNIYDKICSLDNLILADLKARKGKSWQYGVRVFDRNKEMNLHSLHQTLFTRNYRTSPYTKFTVFEPKQREVFRLPYFPDRITHHAVVNILEPYFTAWFTRDTYSCIKLRGIHGAARGVKAALQDVSGTTYCLKLDIKKFYPSVDHDILKGMLRRKIKDAGLIYLLDEIIDSAPGLPIGNYLSQYLANFYLTGFDHWIKEVKNVRYYFRYADDLVILSSSKEYLRQLLSAITLYLEGLKLRVNPNHQIFPVDSRGIDFVGYVFRHGYTRLRKGIKKSFAKAVKEQRLRSIVSYYGWAKHCNSRRLLKKLNVRQ